MPRIRVKGRNGDQLEVNDRPRGAFSTDLKRVPVDAGWTTFKAVTADGAIWHISDHQIQPSGNPVIDVTRRKGRAD